MRRLFIRSVTLLFVLSSITIAHKVFADPPVVTPKATITITLKLAAKNMIISESVAKDLTEQQLQSLMAVVGSDLVGLELDKNTVQTANAGLKGKNHMDIPVTWSTPNETVEAHLIVVADEAVISSDGQKAVNAYPVTIGKADAHLIGENSDQASLDFYTQAQAYHSDGTVRSAFLKNSTAAFSALKTAKANNIIQLIYSFSDSDKELFKTVDVKISSGSLNFTSAPKVMDFGQLKVRPSNLIAFPSYQQDVVVTDTRPSSVNTGWTMFVKETQALVEVNAAVFPFTRNRSLAGSLWFNRDGENKTMLSPYNATVESQSDGTNGGEYNISQKWGEKVQKGIYLDIPVTQQYTAKYQGRLTWSLSDIPENK